MRRALVALVAILGGCTTKSTGGGGEAGGVAPVLASFSATPSSIPIGLASDVTWSWSYANAPSPAPACSIDRGVGAIANGGTTSVTLSAGASFVLTCINSKGSATAFTTVAAVPVAPEIATFTPSPASVPLGAQTDVTWAWTYANVPAPEPACSIDHGVGTVTSGTATGVTLSADTVYTVTCTNDGGLGSAQATVFAVPPPAIASFSASRTAVPSGASADVTFTWSYAGAPTPAPTCTIDHGMGEVTSPATRTVNITSDTVYTLTCTNTGGSGTAQVTIAAVAPPAIGSFTVSPTSLAVNVPTSVRWTWTVTPAGTSCSIDGGIGAIASGTSKTVWLPHAKTYRLTCTNGGGSAVADVTLAVNECAANLYDCGPHSHCVETVESYDCACNAGYVGDGNVCSALVACDVTPGLCSANATCTATGSGPACVCAPGWAGDGLTCERMLLAFVTSVTGRGNLSEWADAGGNVGVAAGDAVCQARAAAARLPGTYVAWISDSTSDAYCRVHGMTGKKASRCGQGTLPVAAGPWLRTDLLPFAPTIDRLLSPNFVVYHPAAEDEFGVMVTTAPEDVFTGTSSDGVWGGWLKAAPCRDWTSADTNDSAFFGFVSGDGFSWSAATEYGTDCVYHLHLRCLERGSGPALPTFHSSAKKAFATSVAGSADLHAWADAEGFSGVEAADAICRARARAGGLSNAARFKAFISTSSTSAVSRITSDGPWVRVDGALVARNHADLFDGSIIAPLDITELGTHATYYVYAWTGTTPAGDYKVDWDCAAWTDAKYPTYGQFGVTYDATHWLNAAYGGCGVVARLFCFED